LVNVESYHKNNLSEQHAFGLFVGKSKAEAKHRALQSLLKNSLQQHKDDLIEVENHLLTANCQNILFI